MLLCLQAEPERAAAPASASTAAAGKKVLGYLAIVFSYGYVHVYTYVYLHVYIEFCYLCCSSIRVYAETGLCASTAGYRIHTYV